MKPDLRDQMEWTIWQYSNLGKFQGYAGEEKFIDMNVFQGSLEDLFNLGQ